MVSVKLPILTDNSKNIHRLEQEKLRNVLLQKTPIENELVSRGTKALVLLVASGNKAETCSNVLIPAAKEKLSNCTESYQAAGLELAELIEARQQLLETELGYKRAVRDYLQQAAQLCMLTGRQWGQGFYPVTTEVKKTQPD